MTARVRKRVRGGAAAVGVLVAAVLCAAAVRADVASDQPAAILVFPKIIVDTAAVPVTPRGRVDTLIRVSNTSASPITLWCFYMDATPLCTNGSGSCVSAPVTCSPLSACKPHWNEVDFIVHVTAGQPIAWLASEGAIGCGPEGPTGKPCLPLTDIRPGPNGQVNNGGLLRSLIPPVAQDPFIGELKCIAVDQNEVPVDRNDLKGEAEFIQSNVGRLDVAGYNAIGIQATGRNNGDPLLVLGGINAEYNSCPNILILDHFFDGGRDPVSGELLSTSLTLVPCSEDFATQQPLTTTVQFRVFNEFEQALSTSRQVTCFQEFVRLTDIDRSIPERSIFSAAVQGTLTGQTRMRGVADQHEGHGHGLLGLAEEFRERGGSASFALHFQGTRFQSDVVRLPDGL